MEYTVLIEHVGKIVELSGVAIIVIGLLASSIAFGVRWFKNRELLTDYKSYRQNLGRSILLGLEFLVAGDIIRSIAVPPTLTTVFVLAIIVLIRSFLAVELEMEIEGKWPWQRKPAAGKS